MRVVISGIPGSGKTTVLTEALKCISMPVVNYGDVMFDFARQTYKVTQRDEMRSLPHQNQKDLQLKAAQKIGTMDNVIVDTHCTVKTPFGYLPGLPHDVLTLLNPHRIILVETPPEDIETRRQKDADIRHRDTETIDDMHLHQLMNRIAAMSYAAMVGATVKIIPNRQGKLDEAANDLVQTLK